jgi:hypothetical protein
MSDEERDEHDPSSSEPDIAAEETVGAWLDDDRYPEPRPPEGDLPDEPPAPEPLTLWARLRRLLLGR